MDTPDLEVTSNLNVANYAQSQEPPTEGVPNQQADDAQLLPPDSTI